MAKNNHYDIMPAKKVPETPERWDGDFWRQALPLAVNCFRPEGSEHHPQTLCKLLYDEMNIFGIFRVADQYIQCTHTGFQTDVWKDSCVEFFVRSAKSAGYFNFEFNCGGALLASYVTDPLRIQGRLKEYISLTSEDNNQIQRYASLPAIVKPEILTPLVWILEFSIPFHILEKYAGIIGNVKGQIWQANFYKCGNETSHPHWASWMPLTARNFHDPGSFGQIIFR